jgi:hypothetical protein
MALDFEISAAIPDPGTALGEGKTEIFRGEPRPSRGEPFVLTENRRGGFSN